MASITFRCSEREKIEIEQRASNSGMNITDYVKARLLGTDDSRDLLQAIAERLEHGAGDVAGPGGIGRGELAMLVELLLMMRHTVKPDTQRQAQAEVERLGLEVWSSETAKRG
ncbi:MULTISPECIES: plasmid mobilization protein [Xanthomonas]|uniref:plasmid mobilization protein n=1 Tax=Xanthomonas TaxID=338 RepID=UPI0019D6B7BF|nr:MULTISPECIES: hypothetical protein [Xanthomonas]QSQ54783.1 hypothetical protein ISN36_19525 [Xanthomonas translucens pv. undulosa]QSQ62268.1 hypothetical protein ISN38_19840 [Xanthomonas translucens pv. undulosa]WCI07408.1 hypothetical protein PML25_23025 [Xanthomonas hortorum pv. pelargonii]WIH07093.1 hypothetical protein KHF85_20135 [Xanthomonas translucens pv. graminis]